MPESIKRAPTPLLERIAKARDEGRTQQALELTREIHKREPTAHRELLEQVLLERARQLEERGYLTDAIVVLGNAAHLGSSPEFLAEVAERLAACDDGGSALHLAASSNNSKLTQEITSHASDNALQRGPAGKTALPPEHHAGFDLIVQAFAQVHAGQDDDARATLQGVGLLSPFLEWKLLLRGMLRYYGGDDTRALENWSRLDPKRLPYRIAAPWRLGIDAGFRAAQSAATRTQLQKQVDRLLGSGLRPRLQKLQSALAEGKTLGPAFRHAEAVLPELRRDFPQLVPRLADCFFWTIVQRGQPEDLDRFERSFLVSADRSELYRLEALALEESAIWPEANAAWQELVKALEISSDWSDEMGTRARALVWERMGRNAEMNETTPDSFPFFVGKSKAIKPTAEQCYKKCLSLAPDRLESHLALFDYYCGSDSMAKACEVGRRLLERFPEHLATAEALGDLFFQMDDFHQSKHFLEKAFQGNALSQKVRQALNLVRLNLVLTETLAGNFDAARAELDQAEALGVASPAQILCQRATLETKAKNLELAQTLAARAVVIPDRRLAVLYSLVCLSIRAKLPPKERKRLANALADVLTLPATAPEALSLLATAGLHRVYYRVLFTGQKKYEKMVVDFVSKFPLKQFDQEQMEGLCMWFKQLEARKEWGKCVSQALERFPASVPCLLSQADFFLSEPNPLRHLRALRELMKRARKVVNALPPGTERAELTETLQERDEAVRAIDAGRGILSDLMDRILSENEDDDDPDE